MGKRAPSAPPVPNVNVVTGAQQASNLQTAQEQAALNRVNQVTPQGNLTYTAPPSGNATDPWTATQTYSPAELDLFNKTLQGQGIYAQTALNQLGSASGALSMPINTNYEDVRNQVVGAQMSLLNPTFTKMQGDVTQQLHNAGVDPGSVAGFNALNNLSQTEGATLANVTANAGNQVGQAISQQIALRDQPVNEATALLTGQMISNPQFQTVPQTQVAPTNVMGAFDLAQQQQQFNYAQQMQNVAGMYGGIGGLAGSLGGAAIMGGAFPGSPGIGPNSDERLKTDMEKVGEISLPGGRVPITAFRYKGDPTKRLGFIAQDVEKVDPASVFTHPVTGMKGVNYARVLMGAHFGKKEARAFG